MSTPMRLRFYPLLLAALLVTTAYGRDEQRITQLKETVASLEAVMADSASPKADRARLQKKLDTLRKELGILEEREAIETRERQLRAVVNNQTREWMREKLQTVSAQTTEVEARQRELDVARTKAAAERALLMVQREDKSAPLTDARRAELDEKLYTKNEEIRAIALQQEAAEYELMLIQLAKKFREQLLNEDAAGARLALRAWFDKRSEQQDYASKEKQLGAVLGIVTENLSGTQAGLDLARQKLGKFDEELEVLERQTGFLRRNVQLEQLLATQRAQKQFVGLRIPFLVDQVEALSRSRDILQTQKGLVAHQVTLLGEQMTALWASYINRLLPPLTAVAVMILTYLLGSRLLLPRFFRKEELFMARRLGRYGTTFLVTMIMVVYMLEDLRVIAATLGLVSAAIVIALQDVAISFFGWSVIMVSRKFVIGDRLEIDGTLGDVIDIQLLRTTFLEINNWLGVDQPTGRVVIIPNSFVFRSKVFNSSHCHPYTWEKLEVTVTFDTPLADATALLARVLEEETRDDFAEAQQFSTLMQQRYGVEDAEYKPKLYTRIGDSGITFSMLYVGHYRDTTTRNRINLRLIAELEKARHIQLAYKTFSVQTSATQRDKPSAVLHSHSPFAAGPAG